MMIDMQPRHEMARLDSLAAHAWRLCDATLAEAVMAMHEQMGRSVLVSICGAQGSGKTTTTVRLADRLRSSGLGVVTCSLDDYYLSKAHRKELAVQVHPLLATRGVPGTHDIGLLSSTVSALLKGGTHLDMPLFDKASDDLVTRSRSPSFQEKADIVVLEGWCFGARPQGSRRLRQPINGLEKMFDISGGWRTYVNQALATSYGDFFATIDLRILLKAPSFECVSTWRMEQELGLDRSMPDALPIMTAEEINRFVAHFERITRWLLEDEPADVVVDLDEQRAPRGWRLRQG